MCRISPRNTHITTQLPLLLTVLLALLLAGCEAAKGGAKSVINRNRRQRTRGGHHGGGYHGDDAVEGGEGHNLTPDVVCSYVCSNVEFDDPKLPK